MQNPYRLLLAPLCVASTIAASIAGCESFSVEPASDGPGDGSSGNDGDVAIDAGDAGDAAAPPGMVRVRVKAPPFDIEPTGDPEFDPWLKATLTSDFYMDDAEVTVERFRAWVKEFRPPPCDDTCSLDPGGPFETAMSWRREWLPSIRDTTFSNCQDGTYSRDAGPTNLPMNCVNWYQANAFCFWDGEKRLPTHAEWVYAASGHGDHRPYAWGSDEPTCQHGILDLRYDGAPPNCGALNVPVRSTPLGRSIDGVWDMLGSLYEWVWDRATLDDGGVTLVVGGQTNFTGPPIGADVGEKKMLTGGYAFTGEISSYTRTSWEADYSVNGHGFRCVKTAR